MNMLGRATTLLQGFTWLGAASWAERRFGPYAQLRWLYVVLGTVVLLKLVTSFVFSQYLIGLQAESVRLNREWNSRLERYTELGQLAIAVNAPGNDVFASRDPDQELDRLNKAGQRFDSAVAAERNALDFHVEEGQAALRRELDAADASKQQVVAEAQAVLACLAEGRLPQAAERMVVMDRHSAALAAALARLQQQALSIQEEHLAGQQASADSVRGFGYVLAVVVLIIVGGITWYGSQLSTSLRALLQERERSLASLSWTSMRSISTSARR